MYGHTRFLNQEDIINEIQHLISPTKCNDINIRTTKSHESYYDKDGKKTRSYHKMALYFLPYQHSKKAVHTTYGKVGQSRDRHINKNIQPS